MIRTYVCTVVFENARIKPRTVTVKGEGIGRKEARAAARSQVAEAHPDWPIDHVKATYVRGDEPAPEGKSLGEVEAKRKPRKRKPADPVKQAAAAHANKKLAATLSQLAAEDDPEGVARWWVEYRAYTAEARSKAEALAELAAVAAE